MADAERARPKRRKSDPDPAWERFNPWLFFGALFTPAVLTTITFNIDNRFNFDVSMIIWSIASLIAGLVCGTHFTRSLRYRSTGAWFFIWIGMVASCAALSALIGFAGCRAIDQIDG